VSVVGDGGICGYCRATMESWANDIVKKAFKQG